MALGDDGEPSVFIRASGGDCRAGAERFGPGQWPPGCRQPYGTQSPFNRPVPSRPRVHPRSRAIVARVMELGAKPANIVAGGLAPGGGSGAVERSFDYGHPTFYSSPDDPLFILRCESFECPSLEGRRIRVPDAAQPAGELDERSCDAADAGFDNHMTVVDQDRGLEYDLWNVCRKPPGGGELRFSSGGLSCLRESCSDGGVTVAGDGLNPPPNARWPVSSGATAAHFANLAGVIRAQELEVGSIDHALFMVIECGSGDSVPPARPRPSGSPVGSRCPVTADAPPIGARFQLDMSEREIAALSLPPWKRAIVTAMARYGMYFGDTGGQGFGVLTESGSTYTSFGEEDRLARFARAASVEPTDSDRDGLPEYALRFSPGDLGRGGWGARLRVLAPAGARPAAVSGRP